MKSLWIFCVILALLLPTEIHSQDKKKTVNLCQLRVMVFADYMRTMCAPLQAVWVLSSKGFCRKGYTCTKGYTEAECKKECLTKPTTKLGSTAVTEKALNDIVGEKTIKVNVTSVRTRRPRTRKPTILED
ncbi:uncharacterized protein LOC117782905 [Drosophila innubila]|uniref:uncharacterized protein LOC117782905 n=1 Tax=Drosophila innubila TaxID=198719 RepID=UPI00148D88F1|nr:uncharacterized protein LOC117782905 [Drosophila innubila]